MIGESGRKGTFDCPAKVSHLGIMPYYATELMQEVYWRSGERVKGCLGGGYRLETVNKQDRKNDLGWLGPLKWVHVAEQL